MGDYFVGQTNLRISVETNATLTDASSLKVRYTKPDDTEIREFDATIDPSDDSKMYYDVQDGDLDLLGHWYFWAYVIFSDSTVGIGGATKVLIKPEGSE